MNTIVKTINAWSLLWICVLCSEVLAALLAGLIGLLFHERITSDQVITGGVTVLLVSSAVAFMFIRLIETLRHSEQQANELLENSAVATFVLDPGHKVVHWNKACEELTGIPSAAMIGTDNQWKPFYAGPRQTLADVVIDGNVGALPGLYGTYAQSVLNKKGLLTEGWYRNMNGRDRYIIFDAAPVYDNKGKLSLVIETLQDVTAQKRMEEKLAKSETQLRTVINAEPECVKMIAADGTLLEVNPAGLAMFEADSLEQVAGASIMPLIAPEHRSAMQTLVEKVFHGESDALEFEIVGLQGGRRWLDTRAVPLRNAQGDIFALLGVARDITMLKRGEHALRDPLQCLQLLIDTIPMPVFYKDANGIYQGCNKAFADYLGQPEKNIVGKTAYDIAPRELADRYHAMDRELLENPGIQIYEFSIQHADGTHHDVIFNKATYRDSQGNVAGLIGVVQDITARKRMEETLKQANETLRAVIQASPLAVVSFDANGNVDMWNSAAEGIFGWREREVRGCFNPLVAEENKHEFLDLLKRVLQGESLMEMELRRQKKDRSPIDVSVSSAPIRNVKNDIVGIVSLISDISEHKKAKQLIQRNYDTQAAINWILNISLKNIPLDGILKQTLDLILSIPWLSFESRGSIFLVEEGAETLVMKVQRGLSDQHQEECKIVPFGKCVCGRAAAKREVQFVHTVDERHEVRYEGLAPHGHYCVPILQGKTVLGVINLYLKEGHQREQKEIDFLAAIASALAGIIQRKRVEEERAGLMLAITRSQKEWQETFDSITDMISIHDEHHAITRANKAFAKHFNLEPRDVVGRRCGDLFHPQDATIMNCPHARSLAENRPGSEEVLDPKTGRILLVTTFPYSFPDSEERGTIHVTRDITDEREKEMRLIMSERLASLGQMASGIAHEINNPLAAIAGCAEGLLNRVRQERYDAAFFANYLTIIQEEIVRCKAITTGMLSIVRKTSYLQKTVAIHDVLNRTLEIIGFQGRLKELEVIKKYAEKLPVVFGSEGELKQVFLSIITNALDALEDKGVLTVRTEVDEHAVTIRISDNGPGISPELLPKIFEPFFTTKSEKGGTGLGLSIAKKILDNHHGSIAAASDPGTGTTFTITMPLPEPGLPIQS
jgi:PAS domain S-box-containing protein